jgi:hypothetical protein
MEQLTNLRNFTMDFTTGLLVLSRSLSRELKKTEYLEQSPVLAKELEVWFLSPELVSSFNFA